MYILNIFRNTLLIHLFFGRKPKREQKGKRKNNLLIHLFNFKGKTLYLIILVFP